MEPAVKPAAIGSKSGVVGVLATRGTFNGRLYRKTSALVSNSVRIIECVADEFVDLVERGIVSGEEAESVVRKRIEPLLEAGADHIALGCTHFPHLKPMMEKVAARRAEFVDPSDAVARRIVEVLERVRRED
jgi:glutamate racemase